MVYSIVNAPTLVRDLARLDTGGQVATDLLHAVAMTPADFAALATVVRAPDLDARRATALAAVAAHRPSYGAVEAVGAILASAPLEVLTTATIGRVEDLLRFLRLEVMAAIWSPGEVAIASHPAALEHATDGVVASYAGVTDLGTTWQTWCAGRELPAPPNELLIAAIRRLTDGDIEIDVPAEWAAYMHDACWAVHLTGRGRDALVAQLHALRALVEAVGPQPRPALVATVVAAAHAGVVVDLLDPMTHTAMTQPFLTLLP